MARPPPGSPRYARGRRWSFAERFNYLSYTTMQGGCFLPLHSKVFQKLFHRCKSALNRNGNRLYTYTFPFGYLGHALAENDASIDPAALYFGQRIESAAKALKPLHALDERLRRGLMHTGRLLDPVVTVEGIVRLVAPNALGMGGLIELVRTKLGGHLVGYFNKLVGYVPRVKVPQIDRCHSE